MNEKQSETEIHTFDLSLLDNLTNFILCDFTHESLQNAFHRIYRENLKVQNITVSSNMLKYINEHVSSLPTSKHKKIFSETNNTLFGYKLVIRDLICDKIVIFYKKGK